MRTRPLSELEKASIEVEFQKITEAMQKTKFNKSKAARLLGIDRKTMYNKILAYEFLQKEIKGQPTDKNTPDVLSKEIQQP